ncbi:MAG: hypothetical protein ACLQVI_10155 [Polyangiaceae bacterium]
MNTSMTIRPGVDGLNGATPILPNHRTDPKPIEPAARRAALLAPPADQGGVFGHAAPPRRPADSPELADAKAAQVDAHEVKVALEQAVHSNESMRPQYQAACAALRIASERLAFVQRHAARR